MPPKNCEEIGQRRRGSDPSSASLVRVRHGHTKHTGSPQRQAGTPQGSDPARRWRVLPPTSSHLEQLAELGRSALLKRPGNLPSCPRSHRLAAQRARQCWS